MNIPNTSRQILIHGLALIFVGLVWGLVVPHTPFPKLALTAHIEFESNGLLIAFVGGLLLTVPHRAGSKSVGMMLLATWLTWTMALSEAANSWWGTNQLLSQAAKQAGATGGTDWQEAVIKLTHISSGLALIVAFALLIAGFVKAPEPRT